MKVKQLKKLLGTMSDRKEILIATDEEGNGFGTIEEAKVWVDEFVTWYNTVHLHSSIKFVTPESRHSVLDRAILENRKDVYEAAKAKNPNRWSGETRNWNIIEEVSLNPLTTSKELHTLNGIIN